METKVQLLVGMVTNLLQVMLCTDLITFPQILIQFHLGFASGNVVHNYGYHPLLLNNLHDRVNPLPYHLLSSGFCCKQHMHDGVAEVASVPLPELLYIQG